MGEWRARRCGSPAHFFVAKSHRCGNHDVRAGAAQVYYKRLDPHIFAIHHETVRYVLFRVGCHHRPFPHCPVHARVWSRGESLPRTCICMISFSPPKQPEIVFLRRILSTFRLSSLTMLLPAELQLVLRILLVCFSATLQILLSMTAQIHQAAAITGHYNRCGSPST